MSAARPALVAAFALALALAGCGFRPLYGSYGLNPGAQRIFASIYVAPVEADHAGYELRNALIDLLEASASPSGATYKLSITLTESRQGVAVQPNASITRYNYELAAAYDLIDTKTGKSITRGREDSLTAYNVISSSATAAYGTLAARRDAQKHATDDIAQRIRTDLGVYFSQTASSQTANPKSP